MVKQGRIAQYRERLDRTLVSPDLTDDEALTALVKDHILRSRDNYDKDQGVSGQVNDSLSKRVAELSNLLGMFRSVSDNYAASPNERSHSSWKLKSDSEELRVMYREGPLGSPFHTLLVEGYVDAPVDACLCVSWETAIYKTWFPETKIPTFKVTTAKCLQKIRDNEHISLVRMKLSWPLTDREAVLHYFEFEYFKDELVIVVINSVPDGESILYESKGFMDDETAEAGQTVRVDYIGGFALQKVTEGRSYFRRAIEDLAPDKPLDPAVLTRLNQFSAMNKLKKMALRVIAESLSEEEIAGLKEMFRMIDTDNSGQITFDELKEGLKKFGASLEESEIRNLMQAADVDNNNTIDYGEFIAAMLHLNRLDREDHLFAAFSYFDKDGSGYITRDELQQACQEFGTDDIHLEEIMKEVDQDNDGRIDYNEFVAMMRRGNPDVGKKGVQKNISLSVREPLEVC